MANLVDQAVYEGRDDLFELLVELGVPPKEWDPESGTCSHTAITRKQSHMIPGLIALGYNTSYIQNNGFGFYYPLSQALQLDDLASVRALLEGGADPNVEGVDGIELDEPLVDLEGTSIFPGFCCTSIQAVDLLHEFGAKFEAPPGGNYDRFSKRGLYDPSVESWARDAVAPIVTAAVKRLGGCRTFCQARSWARER